MSCLSHVYEQGTDDPSKLSNPRVGIHFGLIHLHFFLLPTRPSSFGQEREFDWHVTIQLAALTRGSTLTRRAGDVSTTC